MGTKARWTWLTAAACGLAAVGLLLASSTAADAVRSAVRDALRPGVGVLHDASSAWHAWQVRQRRLNELARRLDQLQAERDHWRQQAQALAAALLATRQQLQLARRTGRSPTPAADSEPLLVAELVRARVLGPADCQWLTRRRLLDAGVLAGVEPRSLVLEPTAVLDQGSVERLSPGLPVFAGRCVVGKVVQAGRFVSVVQPVTDPEFRAYAQLARPASAADAPNRSAASSLLVFGARGLLRGNGDGTCRLLLIERTEPVRVGDLVLTADRDGLFPYPMLFGTVVQAQLRPGQPHWQIRVRPAVRLDELPVVEVLRKRLNPRRLARTETADARATRGPRNAEVEVRP